MMSSVAVIGAGIAGASAAFGLAARGVGVTIFDDAMAGQATAASAGIIAPWVSSSTGSYYETYAAGGNFYPEFLARLAELGIVATSYRKTGALIINRDPAVLAEAERGVRTRAAAAGVVAGEVHDLDGAALAEVFPPVAPDMHGVLVTGGGRVDGRVFKDAIISAAQLKGAVVQRDSVVELGRRPGSGSGAPVGAGADGPGAGIWQVRTTSARLDFDAIVLAAGVRTRELLVHLGHDLDLVPQRGQITHLSVPGAVTSAWPTVHPLDHHYIAPFDGGRVVVGATREDDTGIDPRITAAGQLQVLEDALGIAPGLAGATLLETRVGLRPMSGRADQLPYAGAVPGEMGLWVAGGFGAGGLTMGPLIGDGLARLILGEAAPEIAHLAL